LETLPPLQTSLEHKLDRCRDTFLGVLKASLAPLVEANVSPAATSLAVRDLLKMDLELRTEVHRRIRFLRRILLKPLVLEFQRIQQRIAHLRQEISVLDDQIEAFAKKHENLHMELYQSLSQPSSEHTYRNLDGSLSKREDFSTRICIF